jgi:AAA+ ATPase superfamily predicted ATPase
MSFIGRARELEDLDRLLHVVVEGRRADQGVALLLRGRRRVGKSRLVSEFIARSGLPSVYFQAARGAPPGQELDLLAQAVAVSSLPLAAVAAGNTPSTLTAALMLLGAALPDTPSVVVIDEVPWLLEGFAGGAGELQRAWDTVLSRKPVLLLLLGSDLSLMEQLAAADQPFHARATEMVLHPLNPVDVQRMTELEPFDAIDAYLLTGGLPLIAQEWRPGESAAQFFATSVDSSTSALVVAGTRVLDGEVGETSLAHQVLRAIGGRGERTFTGIQQASRGAPLNAASLTTSLRQLQDKRIVTADEPLSTRSGRRDRRYRIADPALRFWLAFVEPALSEIDRGRGDLAVARFDAGYPSWRGRAVEPVVRDALERLLPDERWPAVSAVGGWWPRNNIPEIDLVGADRPRSADTVSLVGTVKWRQRSPVTAAEVAALARDAAAVPGVDVGTALVAVCPAGSRADGLAQVWDSADLLRAWP